MLSGNCEFEICVRVPNFGQNQEAVADDPGTFPGYVGIIGMAKA